MNILIITAHPSPKGFTHKISLAYKKGVESVGHIVEILHLYDHENQSFLSFEDAKAIPPSDQSQKMQDKIVKADELVFVYPIWWMGPPAILKNFIDNNFTSGFAYKYVKFPILKGRPVGLLKGKKARVFVTTDGAKWMYRLILTPFKLNFKYFFLLFCGIRTRSFIIFGRMLFRSEEKKQKWLEKVENLGKNT